MTHVLTFNGRRLDKVAATSGLRSTQLTLLRLFAVWTSDGKAFQVEVAPEQIQARRLGQELRAAVLFPRISLTGIDCKVDRKKIEVWIDDWNSSWKKIRYRLNDLLTQQKRTDELKDDEIYRKQEKRPK